MATALQPILGLGIMSSELYYLFVFLGFLILVVMPIAVIATIVSGIRETRRRNPTPASAYDPPEIEPSVMRFPNDVSSDLQTTPHDSSEDQSPE